MDFEQLRALTEAWFFEHSLATDPTVAYNRFKSWVESPRSRWDGEIPLQRFLEFAGGVTRTTVLKYLGRVAPGKRLEERTLWDLDYLCLVIGESREPREPPGRQGVVSRRGARRIALLCDLDNVPSPRFHMETIKGLIRAGEKLHYSVAIHSVSGKGAGLAAQVGRVLRLDRPDGVICFRLTPGPAVLEMLNLGRCTPAVVVHVETQVYPKPVLGHVFPDQSRLGRVIEEWCVGHSGQAVVVAMPEEESPERSLRNVRIRKIEAGLRKAGLSTQRWEVPDYAADHAAGVVSAHPDAAVYVCLSDEIAVAVAQRVGSERVLGFDDSPLARRHGVDSFDQSLDEIGDRTWELFTHFFAQGWNWQWPPFRESRVALVLRRHQ